MSAQRMGRLVWFNLKRKLKMKANVSGLDRIARIAAGPGVD